MPGQRNYPKPPRILVVEDNYLVAEAITEALVASGYEVVGPAPSLRDGLALALNADIDGAFLDVDLGGRFCFPIAKVLADRKVPFLFLTGYHDPSVIPPELRSTWRLTKPFHVSDLSDAAARAFGAASA